MAVTIPLVTQQPPDTLIGRVLLIIGLCALLGAAIIAGLVVTPHTSSRYSVKGTPDTLWYGELRCRDPADLAADLASQTEAERLLLICQGTVTIARIAWHKAALLRHAMQMTLLRLRCSRSAGCYSRLQRT